MHHTGSAHRDIYDWQREEIFSSAEDFFANMLAGINSAKHSIDMDYYIFDVDALGQSIINALLEAAKRNVHIRLMIDGLGSGYNARKIASALNTDNIQVRIFHPFPFALNVFHWSSEKGNTLQKFLHFFRNINQRNHHKFCIIDEQHLWTGSFNISVQHLSVLNGGDGWHDYGVRITDNKLQPIINSFNHLFENSTLNNKKLFLQKIRSNITSTLRRISNNLIVRKISYARHRVWICNAYFSPSYKVLKAIKSARKNGVTVNLILPAISDIFFMPWLSRTYYKQLIKYGVEIFEYQPSVLHAKLLLIDDQCLLGSTNLNHRSFHHDLELDIVLSKPETIQQIEQWLLADMKHSKAISLEYIKQQRVPLFFAQFLRVFRHWL